MTFICGTRVSTLAQPKNYERTLTWKSWRFLRGSTGGINVKVVFENYKGGMGLDKARYTLSEALLSIREEFFIRSPRSIDNVELSVPHRALALLLLREQLRDYSLRDTDCIQNLINGNEAEIKMKSEVTLFLRSH